MFKGAWPALLSPTTSDGDLDVAALVRLTQALLAKGAGGFYVCGSTGEGVFMTTHERKLLAEIVVAELRGAAPVIVHVGCAATREAVHLAKHAQSVGAAAVASILPPFRRGVDSIYAHFEAIAAAASDLPFLPYLFGGEIDAVSLMRELKRRIPNLGGAKYTGPNMFELSNLVSLAEEGWTLFSGMDEQCLFAAMVGAPANIGSTLNPMVGVYRQMRDAYLRGDLSRASELQLWANRITRIMHEFGFPGALCEAMRLLELGCGEPRLPNLPLPGDRRRAFREALAAERFYEIAAL